MSRKLCEQPDLPIRQALRLARLLSWEDHQLAVALWKKAVSNTLPEDLVGDAFFLGNQLGIDPELLLPISKKLFELGREGRGGIWMGDAKELVDSAAAGRESVASADESYITGKVPAHIVMQRLGTTMVSLYHHQLLAKERNPDPIRQSVLLARHGGRLLMEGFPESIAKISLHLDISSVLLAEHLGILRKVESTFAPLQIPTALIPALIQMREQITPHQPLRLEENRQILELIQQDMIQVIDQDSLVGLDLNATLISEMGEDWVALLRSAQAKNGYVVDHVPLSQRTA